MLVLVNLALCFAGCWTLKAPIFKKRYLFLFSFLCLFLLLLPGCSFLLRLKGIVLAQSFFIVSYSDYKTQLIPHFPLVLIFLTGFIGFDPILTLTGAFVVSVPMLLFSFWKDSIGGGDIKLMAAIGFAFGYLIIIPAALLGIFLFYLPHVFREKKDTGKRYAMAPALCVGAFIMYSIFYILYQC